MAQILLTGATGAVGSALAPLFLQDMDNGKDTHVTFLVRAESPEHLDERMKKLFAYWELPFEDPNIRKRWTALRGDVSASRLGLSDADYERVLKGTSHIVHSAGNVKLNQNMDEARINAVTPLKNMVELARACQARGDFIKLDYVSTVGVFGKTSGVMPEEPMTADREYHNTYEAAKGEAEKQLLQEMATGLPATIHRPSMVIGDSKKGKIISFQVFYHLAEFLMGRRSLGFVPDTGEATLDVIPVDYVVQGMKLCVEDPATSGRIFHQCSGPKHVRTVKQWIERLRAYMENAGQKVPKLHTVNAGLFGSATGALKYVVSEKTARALRVVPHFLAYMKTEQCFGNEKSDAYYSKQGLSIPHPDDYEDAVLGYRWGK